MEACSHQTFIVEYGYRGRVPEVKQQVVDIALNGSGIRDTTRVLGISKDTVQDMAYIYLAVAIVAEVAATSALKASEEFTKLIPSLIVIVGYAVAFYLLTLVLRTIPLGITYAVWAGLGIVLVAIVGAILYKQIPDIPAVIGMGLIVAGVVIVNVFSKTISH